jgi:hypothetical protein
MGNSQYKTSVNQLFDLMDRPSNNQADMEVLDKAEIMRTLNGKFREVPKDFEDALGDGKITRKEWHALWSKRKKNDPRNAQANVDKIIVHAKYMAFDKKVERLFSMLDDNNSNSVTHAEVEKLHNKFFDTLTGKTLGDQGEISKEQFTAMWDDFNRTGWGCEADDFLDKVCQVAEKHIGAGNDCNSAKIVPSP